MSKDRLAILQNTASTSDDGDAVFHTWTAEDWLASSSLCSPQQHASHQPFSTAVAHRLDRFFALPSTAMRRAVDRACPNDIVRRSPPYRSPPLPLSLPLRFFS